MTASIKDIFRVNRPPGKAGRADRYLLDIALDLRRLLSRIQRDFDDPAVVWPEEFLSDLAVSLVEFGEDLHADAGLWRSLENSNQEMFGTPLPLTLETDPAGPPTGFDPRRTEYLLWTLWQARSPETCPSPTHPNLLLMAAAASNLLEGRFQRLPKDSGVKNFLAASSRLGWEVKRKLFWLGTRYYLFRAFFDNYIGNSKAEAPIRIIDDFVCQETTLWSGLGAPDVLAGALAGLSAADRAALRSWYERHAAFFRVLSRQTAGGAMRSLEVRNLVNGEPYIVHFDSPNCPFAVGDVVFGSLIPWRGEWYWSGEQSNFKNLPATENAKLRRDFLETTATIAYRYCHAEAALAREVIRGHHDDFVAHFGDDLAIFPDGRALTAAQQQLMAAHCRAAQPEQAGRVAREQDSDQPPTAINFPRDMLDHNEGIGAFFNPAEGQEYLLAFNHVRSGLSKRGKGLTGAERQALRGLILSDCISPAFVRRLLRECDAASLLEVFHLADLPPERGLAFLLRCYKGPFFRNRYPSLALLQDATS